MLSLFLVSFLAFILTTFKFMQNVCISANSCTIIELSCKIFKIHFEFEPSSDRFRAKSYASLCSYSGYIRKLVPASLMSPGKVYYFIYRYRTYKIPEYLLWNLKAWSSHTKFWLRWISREETSPRFFFL